MADDAPHIYNERVKTCSNILQNGSFAVFGVFVLEPMVGGQMSALEALLLGTIIAITPLVFSIWMLKFLVKE